MPSKTIKSALLTCCLFSIHAAQAQVYIINTQTLDPEQLGTGGGHSLSDVKANRAVQLEYYHYSERQAAVANRRQTIMNLAQQIDTLAQSGTDQQTLTLLDEQIRHLQARGDRAGVLADRQADTAALFHALGGGWWNRDKAEAAK